MKWIAMKALIFGAAVLLVTSAAAQDTSGRYAVRAFGVKVGELDMSGSVGGGRYTVDTEFTTTGLVGTVAGVKFLMSADGAVSSGQFRPRSYKEDMDTGERTSRASLSYSGGVARGTGQMAGNDGPYRVSDAEQRGAVDPLTAMFMVLRDQPREGICNFRQKIFDGERLTEVAFGQPKASGSTIKCSGIFKRIGGYSPEDLEKRSSFPLSVTYVAAGDLMRATRMQADTIYGSAVIARR